MARALIVSALMAGVCLLGGVEAAPIKVAAPAASAPASRPAPRWAQLTQQQQQVLAPLAAEWDGFPDVQRHKLLGVAARYPKLTPQEQQRVQSRLQDWARLTPEQRRLARRNFKQLHELPQAERQALKDKIRQDADKKPLSVAPPVTVTSPAPVRPAEVDVLVPAPPQGGK
jgi:hypothetical protein